MPLTTHISGMTQKTADEIEASEKLSLPPPSYMDPLSAVHLPSAGDYSHQQSGGGRRHQSPPVELTPTRLRSTLKVTSRDVGVVKDASMRRQVYQFPSSPTQGSAPRIETSSSSVDDFTTNSDTSSLPLPLPTSRRTSPFAGGHTPEHPAQLDDIFYGSMGAQPEWMDPTASNAFDLISGDSFTATPSLWAMPPGPHQTHSATSIQPTDFTATTSDQRFPSRGASQEPRQMDSVFGQGSSSNLRSFGNPPGPAPPPAVAQHHLPSHPTMNVIPPTPSKESCDQGNDPAPAATSNVPKQVSFKSKGPSESSSQLDLSYYPPDVTTQARFPEENSFNHNTLFSSQRPSLMGRRPLETSITLEDGFAAIERLFTDLSQSTAMPVQQVINAFLKSRGRAVHNVNYWNVYANYFKDHMQQELARLKEEGAATGSSKLEGKGKEVLVDAQGTPSECTMQIFNSENAI